MSRRPLSFADFDEVLAEVERLRTRGWTSAGQWDLAQTCHHLAYFIEGPVDGHGYRVPWLLKALFGRWALRRILKTRTMRDKTPTPQKPLPSAGQSEDAAVARLANAIARFRAHAGEYHDSPFFGHLTRDEWRDLQLIHCAHHLAFLTPKA